MADELDEGQGAAPSAGTQKTEPSAEPMIPKNRFDEINRRLKEMMATQEEAQKTAKKAEEDRLAKEAEWEKLAQQREKERDEAMQKAQAAESAMLDLQRRQSFSEAALKATIPPDRIADAYLLAVWPEEGEINYETVVKELITAKPWLVGSSSSAPGTSAVSGRAREEGGAGDGSRIKIDPRFVPSGYIIPSQPVR